MTELIAILLLITQNAQFQELNQPIEVAQVEDPELKNLAWNRYVTKNFTILSIDNEQGKKLADRIENLKSSALTRWGFPDIKFSKECRIFCVPNYSLLKKLFNLSASKIQTRKELNVIWAVVDDNFDKSILPTITQVALTEYETVNNTTLPFWFKKGCSLLNASPDEVKKNLKFFYDVAKKEQFALNAEQIFNSTEEEYNKQNIDNKKIYDNQAMCLALMLRKEFGEAKLQGYLRLQAKNKTEVVFKLLYGFNDFLQFDKKYISYMKDLCGDIVDEKTPDFYLQVAAVD